MQHALVTRSEIVLAILLQRCAQVVRESIVREVETHVGDSGLQLNLGVRGAWKPLFDYKVIDTDAPSYNSRTPESFLESGAQDVSHSGLLHREAAGHLPKRMAT